MGLEACRWGRVDGVSLKRSFLSYTARIDMRPLVHELQRGDHLQL